LVIILIDDNDELTDKIDDKAATETDYGNLIYKYYAVDKLERVECPNAVVKRAINHLQIARMVREMKPATAKALFVYHFSMAREHDLLLLRLLTQRGLHGGETVDSMFENYRSQNCIIL